MPKTIEEIDRAKAVSIVEIMQSIGLEPKANRGSELVYFSPFRNENTASFSIDTTNNLWIDFGASEKYEKGDSSIGFIMRYHKLNFPAAVEWLLRFDGNTIAKGTTTRPKKESPLTLLAIKAISKPGLISYAETRCISYETLSRYCKEIVYKHNESNRIYTAIGFKNDSNGYELRYKGKESEKGFKGSIIEKDITFIDRNYTDLLVFEGFFDFLSFIELDVQKFPANYLILHSVGMLNRFDFRPVNGIYSYLNNDKAGRQAYDQLKKIHQPKHIINCSAWCFPELNDLNDYLICQNAKRQTEQN